jgi:hypothetical protein
MNGCIAGFEIDIQNMNPSCGHLVYGCRDDEVAAYELRQRGGVLVREKTGHHVDTHTQVRA